MLNLVLSLLIVAVGELSPQGRAYVRSWHDLSSTRIRTYNDQAFEIRDVDEAEEEESDAVQQAVLCLAPPHFLKARAMSINDCPIEWKLRLPPVV